MFVQNTNQLVTRQYLRCDWAIGEDALYSFLGTFLKEENRKNDVSFILIDTSFSEDAQATYLVTNPFVQQQQSKQLQLHPILQTELMHAVLYPLNQGDRI
jgi:hypothetical protein